MNYNKTIKVDKDNKTIKIVISCDSKRYAVDEDFIFCEDVESLIPNEYKGKVKLLEAPGKFISNLNYIDHATEGCWVYQIKEDIKKTTPRKQTTRTRKAKSSATAKPSTSK